MYACPRCGRRVDVVDRGGHVEGHARSLRLLCRRARQLPVELVGADSPVSLATTPAAGRGRAPASTSSRSAASASSRDGARPARRRRTTSTISPRGGCSRVVRGQLGGAAAADFLVQLGQLAADRHRALAGRARRAAPASPPGAAGDSNATSVSGASASSARAHPRARGRKPTKRQRSTGRPEATSARQHGARPRQHLDRQPGRDARAHEREARVGDQRHPRVGHERDQLRRPRSAPTSSPRARAFVVLVEAHERARRSRGDPAAPACGACPRSATTSALARAASTRSVTSSRLPIGVGHTTSRPDRRLRRSASSRKYRVLLPMRRRPRRAAPQYTRYRAVAPAAAAPARRTSAQTRLDQAAAHARAEARAIAQPTRSPPRRPRRVADAGEARWRRWATPKRARCSACSRSCSAGSRCRSCCS